MESAPLQTKAATGGEKPVRPPIDVRPIEGLLERIEATYHPVQIWLFGSRARGQSRADSDWDLFVVVPDDVDENLMDPLVPWGLRKDAHVPADVIPCRKSEFLEARDTVNTLAYEVALEGVLIRGA